MLESRRGSSPLHPGPPQNPHSVPFTEVTSNSHIFRLQKAVAPRPALAQLPENHFSQRPAQS